MGFECSPTADFTIFDIENLDGRVVTPDSQSFRRGRESYSSAGSVQRQPAQSPRRLFRIDPKEELILSSCRNNQRLGVRAKSEADDRTFGFQGYELSLERRARRGKLKDMYSTVTS